MPSAAKTFATLFTIVVVIEMLAVVEGGIPGLKRQKRHGYEASSKSSEAEQEDGQEDGQEDDQEDGQEDGYLAESHILNKPPNQMCETNADCPPGETCMPPIGAPPGHPKYCVPHTYVNRFQYYSNGR